MTPRFPRRGTPESFGWLRVPAKDRYTLRAWERPDGCVVMLHRIVTTLVQSIAGAMPVPHRPGASVPASEQDRNR